MLFTDPDTIKSPGYDTFQKELQDILSKYDMQYREGSGEIEIKFDRTVTLFFHEVICTSMITPNGHPAPERDMPLRSHEIQNLGDDTYNSLKNDLEELLKESGNNPVPGSLSMVYSVPILHTFHKEDVKGGVKWHLTFFRTFIIVADLELPEAEATAVETVNKKEFTLEQLVTIRDQFADMCDKQIERGNRDLAQEYLEIINVVQAMTGCDEYKNLEDFCLDESGTYSYAEKRDLDEMEEAVVDEMIAFAKAYDTEPWESLKTIVNNYLEDMSANTGMTRKDTIDRRTICINKLIILCIHACTGEELKRLDGIVKELAENF